MSITAANSEPQRRNSKALGDYNEYVTVMVGDQIFGLPIDRVHDVFIASAVTEVPLAPREIMGLLNLRGRVVTSMCLRRRLGLPDAAEGREMAVGLEHQGDRTVFSSTRSAKSEAVRRHPRAEPGLHGPALSPIEPRRHRLDDKLLIILDVDAVLALDAEARAA